MTHDIGSGRAIGTTQACLGLGNYSFQKLDDARLCVLRGVGRESPLDSIAVTDINVSNGNSEQIPIKAPSWLQLRLNEAVVQGASQWLGGGTWHS